MAKDCKLITFHKRGGKAVKIKRCRSRKLRQHAPASCRALLKREVKRAHGHKGKLANAFYAYNACRSGG